MFDIGWTEMTVIVILAIIVIGPKDLPKVLRTLGQWLRKARAIAREFQGGLDEVMRETELDELKRQVESAARFDPKREAEKIIDPGGEIAGALGQAKPESGSPPAGKPESGSHPAAKPESGSDPAAKPESDLRDQLDGPRPGSSPDGDRRAGE
jgi:sec-independent protein translocase protein TatB